MGIIWLLIILMIVLLLQGFIFRLFVLKRLDYNRYFTVDTANVGDKIAMVEILSNMKILPVPYIRLESRMSESLKFQGQEGLTIKEDLYHRSVFFLWGLKRIKRTHSVECVRRGFYSLKTIAATTGGLFGMFQMSKTFPVDTQLTVYPAILDEDEIPIPSKRLMGEVLVKRWIVPDPFLVNGIRPYMDGDSIKDIHWKSSAKSDELRVKTREFTASPRIITLLNVEVSEDQWGKAKPLNTDVIEYGISLATTLCRLMILNGLEAGFATNGHLQGDIDMKPIFIETTGGEGGLLTIYETVSRMVCARHLTFYSFLESIIEMNYTGVDFVVISSFMSTRLATQVERLRRMGNSVTVQLIDRVHDSREKVMS